MRRRRLVGIGVVVAAGCVAAALAFPATVYVPLGLLRHEAFFAGKPTNYWGRALRQQDFMGHAPPAGDTGKVLAAGGAAAVPVLCQLAENPDGNVRMQALLALSVIGPEAGAAAPVLAKIIKTEDNSARFLAAGEALARADPAAAAETLSAVLRDKENLGGRAWALAALLKLAPECQGTLPAVAELLHDPDARLRVEAAHVLWRMKQPAGPVVEALCAEANADEAAGGVQALIVLREMGPAAGPAVPALLKILQRPALPDDGKQWGPPHRLAVLRCLQEIGPGAAAAPALADLLKSGSPTVRAEAARTLGRMGPQAKPALPALQGALRDPDRAVRAAADGSLRLLDAAGVKAPPAE
jgi:HEAT repeat protein